MLYPNITRAEYDALPGINWSALKCGIGKTRAHVDAAKLGRPDTQAFKFGRAFHHWVLQPEKKSEWKVNDAKTTTLFDTLTRGEVCALEAMTVQASELAGTKAMASQETAATWTYGCIECKGLIDGMVGKRIVDLKSTKDASPHAMTQEILRMKYHGQLAWYVTGWRTNGVEIDGASIIAVEKSSPFAAAEYLLGEDWLDLGRREYEKALEVYADGLTSYGTSELPLPEWAGPGVSETDEGMDLS